MRLAGDYLLRAGRSAAQRQGVDAAEWLQRALVLEAEAALAILSRGKE